MKNWRWIMTDLAFGGSFSAPIGANPSVRCGKCETRGNHAYLVSYPPKPDPLGTTA